MRCSRLGYRPGDRPVPGYDYQLIALLGEGAFGEVWKAKAPGDFGIALKLIDLREQAGKRELAVLSQLRRIRHPYLTEIYSSFVLDEDGRLIDEGRLAETVARESDLSASAVPRPFQPDDGQGEPALLVVAMQLGDKCLKDVLEEHGKGGVPIKELLRYMEGAAKGLDHLHEPVHDMGHGKAPVIHRDVKPANILVVGREARVCDFSLLRVVDSDASGVKTQAIGAPFYASPEALRQRPSELTPQSDQYSLAITYMHLRTGELPLDVSDAPSYGEVYTAHTQGKIRVDLLKGANEQNVLRKATASKAKNRYATCSEFVDELRNAIQKDIDARSWRERLRVLLASLAAALAWVLLAKGAKPIRRIIVTVGLVAVAALALAHTWRPLVGWFADRHVAHQLKRGEWRESARLLRRYAPYIGDERRKELWDETGEVWDGAVGELYDAKEYPLAREENQAVPDELATQSEWSKKQQHWRVDIRDAWRQHLQTEIPRLVKGEQFAAAEQKVEGPPDDVLSEKEKAQWRATIQHTREHARLLAQGNWREAAELLRESQDEIHESPIREDRRQRTGEVWDANVRELYEAKQFPEAREENEALPNELATQPEWSDTQQEWRVDIRHAWRQHLQTEIPRLVKGEQFAAAEQKVEGPPDDVLSEKEKAQWRATIQHTREHARLLAQGNWREAAELLRESQDVIHESAIREDRRRRTGEVWDANMRELYEANEFSVAREENEDLPEELATQSEWSKTQQQWRVDIRDAWRQHLQTEIPRLVKGEQFAAAEQKVEGPPDDVLSEREKAQWRATIQHTREHARLLAQGNWRKAADVLRTNHIAKAPIREDRWRRTGVVWDGAVGELNSAKEYALAWEENQALPDELAQEDNWRSKQGRWSDVIARAWLEILLATIRGLVTKENFDEAQKAVDGAPDEVFPANEKAEWQTAIGHARQHADLLAQGNWREAAELLRERQREIRESAIREHAWRRVRDVWFGDLVQQVENKNYDRGRQVVDDGPSEVVAFQDQLRVMLDYLAKEDYEGAREIVENMPTDTGKPRTLTKDKKDGLLAVIDGLNGPDVCPVDEINTLIAKGNWRDAADVIRKCSAQPECEDECKRLWQQVKAAWLADIRQLLDSSEFGPALEAVEDAPLEAVVPEERQEWRATVRGEWERHIRQEWSFKRYGNVKVHCREYLKWFPIDKVPASARVKLLLADCHMYQRQPDSEGEIRTILSTVGKRAEPDEARVRSKARLIELRFDVWVREPSTLEEWIDLFRQYEGAKTTYVAEEADGDIVDARGDPRWLQSERERVIDGAFERAWDSLAAKQMGPAEELLKSAVELIGAAQNVGGARHRERAALEAAVMVFTAEAAPEEWHNALKVLSEYLEGERELSPTRIMVGAEACVRAYLRLPKGMKADAASATMALEASEQLLGRVEEMNGLPERNAVALYREVLAPFGQALDPFLRKVKEEQALEPRHQSLERFHAGLAGFIELHRFAPFQKDAPDNEAANAELREPLLTEAIDLHGRRDEDETDDQLLAGYHVARGHARVELDTPDVDNARKDADRALGHQPNMPSARALLCHALLVRSRGQTTHEEVRDDLAAAINEGMQAYEHRAQLDARSRARLLLNLSYAHLEEANFVRDPTLEDQKERLDRAESYAEEAKELPQRYREYPHVAMGNAYEDLAWIVQEEPVENYRKAISAFREADREPVPSILPKFSEARALYKAIRHTRLAPAHIHPGFQTENDVYARINDLLNQCLGGGGASDPGVRLYLARVARVQGRFEEADEHFGRALELADTGPSKAIYACERARLPLSNHTLSPDLRYKEALKRAKALEELPKGRGGKPDPAKEAAWIYANVALMQGNRNRALGWLDHALRADAAADSSDLQLLLLRARIRITEALRGDAPVVSGALADADRAVEVAVTRFDLVTALSGAFVVYDRAITELPRRGHTIQDEWKPQRDKYRDKYIRVARPSELASALSKNELLVRAALFQDPPNWDGAFEALAAVNTAVEGAAGDSPQFVDTFRLPFLLHRDVHRAVAQGVQKAQHNQNVVVPEAVRGRTPALVEDAAKHLQRYARMVGRSEELASAYDDMYTMYGTDARNKQDEALAREKAEQWAAAIRLWTEARDLWQKARLAVDRAADFTDNDQVKKARTRTVEGIDQRIREIKHRISKINGAVAR